MACAARSRKHSSAGCARSRRTCTPFAAARSSSPSAASCSPSARASSSFVHDLNLLAALGIRLVLVHGARPQIEAELKRSGVRSRYAQGLRITDEAALTAVKQAAGVLRIEIEALLSQGLPELADGRRADPRRLRQLHHRAADRRARRRRLPVHRRGAQGRRLRHPRRARRRRHRAGRAARLLADRRSLQPRRGKTWPRASPCALQGRQAPHVHRQAAASTARATVDLPSSPRDEAEALLRKKAASRRRRRAPSSTSARAVNGGVGRAPSRHAPRRGLAAARALHPRPASAP